MKLLVGFLPLVCILGACASTPKSDFSAQETQHSRLPASATSCPRTFAFEMSDKDILATIKSEYQSRGNYVRECRNLVMDAMNVDATLSGGGSGGMAKTLKGFKKTNVYGCDAVYPNGNIFTAYFKVSRFTPTDTAQGDGFSASTTGCNISVRKTALLEEGAISGPQD